MKKTIKQKNKLQTSKAIIALVVLASGTVYSFSKLAQDNETLVIGSGIVLTYFCVSAVMERMFNK